MKIEDYLWKAGLLAHFGRSARPTATALANQITTRPSDGRTCIDRGGDVLVTLPVTGDARQFGIGWRTESAETHQRWREQQFGTEEQREMVLFLGESAEPFNHLPPEFAALQRQIGGFGRLYSVRGTGAEMWVGWHLREHPLRLLKLLGVGNAWSSIATAWSQLRGVPLSRRDRPWSVEVNLAGRVRIGSTQWARQLESAAKSHRFARLVQELGGDARFAESLYKLTASTYSDKKRRGIGVAMTLLLSDSGIDSAEFVLRPNLTKPIMNTTKLDAHTRIALAQLTEDDNPRWRLMVQTSSEGLGSAEQAILTNQLDGQIEMSLDNTLMLTLPARNVTAVAAFEQVQYIELDQPVKLHGDSHE